MAYEETTFLCGLQRQRRYGTTATPGQNKPKYEQMIQHKVIPSDTLQGLALKYNSSMTEIKRFNKLWCNDSMYLKESLLIPVLSSDINSPCGSTISNGSIPNVGTLGTSRPPSISSVRTLPSQESKEIEEKTETVHDIFSRIDQTIKKTAKNVRKLERDSSVKNDEINESHSVRVSQSQHSFKDVSLTSSPSSPPPVETRRIRTSLNHLQQLHDQFYQL